MYINFATEDFCLLPEKWWARATMVLARHYGAIGMGPLHAQEPKNASTQDLIGKPGIIEGSSDKQPRAWAPAGKNRKRESLEGGKQTRNKRQAKAQSASTQVSSSCCLIKPNPLITNQHVSCPGSPSDHRKCSPRPQPYHVFTQDQFLNWSSILADFYPLY